MSVTSKFQISKRVSSIDVEHFLVKNAAHQTPLTEAIFAGSLEEVQSLMESGAAASVFVKGYEPGSLVSTLPMSKQPRSSVFLHPPPLQNVPRDVLMCIDTYTAQYVQDLKAKSLALLTLTASTPPVATSIEEPPPPSTITLLP